MVLVDFAFGRHHSSRGVVKNVPLPREAFLAMIKSEEGTERLRLASMHAETKRIGSMVMKVVVAILESNPQNNPQPAECESCGRQATDMKGFVCFEANKTLKLDFSRR